MQGHAEIVGAGFAGLSAAIALLKRGWTVRVHERNPSLRSEGFGIAIHPNGLRALDALEVGRAIEQDAVHINRRIVCDAAGDPTADLTLSRRQVRVSRRIVIGAMADKVVQLGGTIVTRSEAIAAEPDGILALADGRRLHADIVIAADGVHSRIRDSLDFGLKRRLLPDGAMRLVIPRVSGPDGDPDGTTFEHWSGRRRLIRSPCSRAELYIALSCLATDGAGCEVPFNRSTWECSFPQLQTLFDRIDRQADWSEVKWVRFQVIRLARWSVGRVAIVGDAAHAMPPNLAQGGGCAITNGLSLATSLVEQDGVAAGLRDWERRERAFIEHTQLWSRLYGAVTSWPDTWRDAAFKFSERSRWIQRQLQRAAQHIPYGS